MRRFPRILKRIGKGILVLIGVLLVALLITRCIFVHQLNSEIAEIKARGEPLTEADLLGPPVPDSENAALVYEKAFRSLPGSTRYYADSEAIGSALKRGDSASLAEARRLMVRYAKALSLARRAASITQCRFSVREHVEYQDRPVYRLRHLSVLLSYDAQLRARSGDMRGAVESTLTMLRIGRVPPGERGGLGALAQESLIRVACSTLTEIVKVGEIDERQARRLDAELSIIDLTAIRKRSLQGERVYFLQVSQAQQEDPVRWVRSKGIPVSFWDAVRARVNPAGLIWQHVFFIGDQAAYLHVFAKLIGSSYRTYGEAKRLEHDAEWGVPFYAIVTKMLAPVYARSATSMFNTEARVHGSRVFLALLTYHDRHKAYPSSLSDVRKEPGWAVPADPFTGREFVYTKKGTGFLLYSLGPDMKDNGGRPQLKGKAYRANAEYDIAWQMTR